MKRETPSERAWRERIDASLARTFAPPAEPAPWLAGVLAANDPAPAPAAARGWTLAALVAAAAAVVLLLLQRPHPEEALRGPNLAAAWSGLAPVGPLSTAAPGEGAAVTRPDVECLYEEMASSSDERTMACSLGDDLAATLTEAYDARVRLRPEAADVLHGPFASAEWPTGTILTGFPDEEVAVLVAERAATHSCCLDVQLPPESPLRVFTWRVDGLMLTEITPLEEPRLLDLFEEE